MALPPSALPRFCLSRRDLPAALQPYVLEIAEEAAPRRRGAVTLSATTTSTLLVPLATAPRPREADAAAVVLAGPRPEAVVVVPDERRTLRVRFTPVGPYALFGVGPAAPGRAGLAFPFHARVRPDLREAVWRYGAAVPVVADRGWSAEAAFAARAALTVAFLAIRLERLAPETAFLRAAVDAIERSRGTVSVRALAHTLGVSESTLRRRFGVLGMPVKRFATIVRFQSTQAYRQDLPGATWAETALRFGYADQSHLVRDHRRFAGTTPTRPWPRPPAPTSSPPPPLARPVRDSPGPSAAPSDPPTP